MGAYLNITHDKFPKQGSFVGTTVDVCFHYNTQHKVSGVIVRDDKEEPYRMIIQLEDGRFVLSTECMYSFPMPRTES